MEATKVPKIIVTVLLLGSMVGISRADDAKFKCPDALPGKGEYVSMEDCSSYFRCINGTANKHTCPKGLYFNQRELCCDWPQNSDCLKMQISSAVMSLDSDSDVTPNATALQMKKSMGISSLSASADSVFPANDSYCKDKEDGLYPYPTDCTLFYHCTNGYTIIKGCAHMAPYVTRLEFNDETKQCDWPWSSGCIATSISTTGTPGFSSATTGVTTTKTTTAEAPSTNFTTTEAPSTNSTTTEAPSTNSTTTEAPSTNSTVTGVPSTNSTATEAPSTKTTATEAPSTNSTTTATPSNATITTEEASSKNTETTPTSTSHHPVVNFSCQEKDCGRYSDGNNCRGYYICTEDKSFVGYKQCPLTLIFNPIVADCDFPRNYNCSSTALQLVSP